MNVKKAREVLDLKKKAISNALTKLTVSDTDDLEQLYFANDAFDNLISKHMGY